jgi:hypothetical protein
MKLAREYYDQLCIEQRLNTVGRGILMALSPTSRESWLNALQGLDLNTLDSDEHTSFHLTCLYMLLQLDPSICQEIEQAATVTDTNIDL